jgi:hypothetical protein
MWLLANDPELMDPGGLPMGERAKKLARNKHSPGLMDPGLRTTGPLAPETPGSSPFPLGNDYPGPGDRLEGEKMNPVSPAPRDRTFRKFFSRHRPGRKRACLWRSLPPPRRYPPPPNSTIFVGIYWLIATMWRKTDRLTPGISFPWRKNRTIIH